MKSRRIMQSGFLLAHGKVKIYQKIFLNVRMKLVLLSILIFIPSIIYSQQDTVIQNLVNFYHGEMDSSSYVVYAKVISMEGKIDTSGGKNYIYTAITFKILDTIKGIVPGGEFTFNQPGGKVGRRSVHVSSSEIYNLNEKAIYFIKNKNLNDYLIADEDLIYGKDLMFFSDVRLDVDFVIKILKKSLTDPKVIDRLGDMLTTIRKAKKEHPGKAVHIKSPLEDEKPRQADSSNVNR
ncbi:MAG TPA: hypothetical protein VMU30_07790 [Bacteroidota bacterium]|nr:hypothetical protein [Bacteroidota bacterium]